MCFWLISTCLGLLPNTQIVNVVNPGLPAPIITPTTTTTTTTTAAPATNTTGNPGGPGGPGGMPPNGTNPGGSPPGSTPSTPYSSQNPNNPPPSSQYPNSPSTPSPYPNNQNPTQPQQTPNGNLISTAPPNPQYPVYNPGAVITIPIVCQNPYSVCVTNPNEIGVAVPGQQPSIDPRLGTTPYPLYQQYQGYPQQSITGYTGQLPTSNVNFPRNKRRAAFREQHGIDTYNTSESGGLFEHNIKKRQSNNCACVMTGTCSTTGGNYGAGFIDFRIVTPGGGGSGPGSCGAGQELCCGGSGGAGGGTQNLIACGVRQQVPTTAVQPTTGQATFGEFPWQAIILTKQNDYVAGGVLINQMNVITVVHRLMPYLTGGGAPNVKVRLGEWDAAGTYEPVPFQEYVVQRVNTHPSYNGATLQYDVAVVRLVAPVPVAPQPGAAATVNRACMPASSALVYNGQRCLVAGWGKNAFGTAGVYQQILKKVEVPIVDATTCQTALRNARLGPSYILDTTSFICAGGEPNKDSCTGDGGSGLVCLSGGQWTVVGLVSWGLGCAAGGVPGVYVNVAALSTWINQQTAAA